MTFVKIVLRYYSEMCDGDHPCQLHDFTYNIKLVRTSFGNFCNLNSPLVPKLRPWQKCRIKSCGILQVDTLLVFGCQRLASQQHQHRAQCRWYLIDVSMIKQGCQVGAFFENGILYYDYEHGELETQSHSKVHRIVTNKETAQNETIHKTQFASS